jgi:hypothetical protein
MHLSLDSEVSLKTFPYRLDGDPHSERSFLKPDSRNLIDRYLKGEIGVHVYLRARNVICDSESHDLAFVFEKMFPGCEDNILDAHSIGHTDSQATVCDCRTDQMKPSVPVDPSPAVEHFEGLSKIKFHTLESTGCTRIGLYSFHERPHLIREILHTPHGLAEFSGIGSDLKFPLLLIGGRVLLEMQNGCIVDAGVQSRAELIEHLSDLERKWQEPITLDGPDEKLPCPVVLYLSARIISLTCIKSIPYSYEGLAVKLRPRDAIPTRLEW